MYGQVKRFPNRNVSAYLNKICSDVFLDLLQLGFNHQPMKILKFKLLYFNFNYLFIVEKPNFIICLHLNFTTCTICEEIWWVLRTAGNRIVQKRKGFNVTAPQCTFDEKSNRLGAAFLIKLTALVLFRLIFSHLILYPVVSFYASICLVFRYFVIELRNKRNSNKTISLKI